MLNGKGLQIGNRVWESSLSNPKPEDFEEIVIASINDIDKVVHDEQDNIYTYDYIYPIPLTPEWLVRMGCNVEMFDGEDAALVDIQGLFIAVPFYIKTHSLKPINAPRARPLRFVHDFQNFLLDITGEEITIKEIV